MQQTRSNNTDAPAPGHPDTPDSIGNARAPIAVLAIGIFAIGTDMFVVAGLLAPLAAELGVTLGVGALAVTAFAVAYAIGAPLLGAALSGRIPRRVLIGSLVLFAASSAVSAVAPTMAVLVIARVFGGLAASVYGPAAAAAAVAAQPPDRRGRALGLLQGASTVAMIAGAPLGLLVATALSWRAAFGIVSVVATTAVLCLLRTEFGSTHNTEYPVGQRLRPLRSPGVVGTLGATVLVMAASNSLYSYLGVLLGTATETVGLWLFIAAFGVGGMAGTWWGGAAADRRGGARVVLTAGFVLTAGSAVLPVAAASPAAAIPVIACWGFAGWAFVPGQQHRLLELGSGPAPFLLALNSSAIQLGFAAGALLGGLVVDTVGVDFLWILAVACGTAGVIMHVVTHVLSRELQS